MSKRYTITLQRQKEYQNIIKPKSAKNPNKEYAPEDSTIGSLVVRDNEKGEDVFQCFVVENIGPSTDTPKQDKRIVARTYGLYWTESGVALPKEYKQENGRARCLSLYTHELPTFKGRHIHIHIGNYPQDTEGCLLLNYTDNKNGTGGQSTQAIKDFYALVGKNGEVGEDGDIKKAILNFELIVKEIDNA